MWDSRSKWQYLPTHACEYYTRVQHLRLNILLPAAFKGQKQHTFKRKKKVTVCLVKVSQQSINVWYNWPKYRTNQTLRRTASYTSASRPPTESASDKPTNEKQGNVLVRVQFYKSWFKRPQSNSNKLTVEMFLQIPTANIERKIVKRHNATRCLYTPVPTCTPVRRPTWPGLTASIGARNGLQDFTEIGLRIKLPERKCTRNFKGEKAHHTILQSPPEWKIILHGTA